MVGVSGWIDSQQELPSLVPPTRGSVMPLDQLAARAFSEQTRLGWKAFLRGHMSSYWKKALFFANTKPAESVVDYMMTKLVKIVFQFSLSLWEFRNGILHGVTLIERRAKWRSLLSDRVAEAFAQYTADPTIVWQSDLYLFTTKSISARQPPISMHSTGGCDQWQ